MDIMLSMASIRGRGILFCNMLVPCILGRLPMLEFVRDTGTQMPCAEYMCEIFHVVCLYSPVYVGPVTLLFLWIV
jgi:hypothetical protein